eukprot:GHUV01042485.1.p1 GENE.GHUV01042485.1~~GHUV01042485.1.p1  ORF type:complete len:238 (+),score=84.08 GHUV01042485.1:346-1059(+)
MKQMLAKLLENLVFPGIRYGSLARCRPFCCVLQIMPNTWNNPSTAYDATMAGVKESIKRVGFPTIDLMLLHAPGQAEGRADAWRALEDAQQQGLLRSIGVSNFGIPHLEKLAQSSRITPAVNQIELHPWLQWRKEVEYCNSKGIILEAYSPLAKASKLSDPKLVDLAQKVNKTPAQMLLRWSLQKGFVVLPKSTNPERQKANADVGGWELSNADMAEMDSWEADLVTGWDPIRDHPV